MSCFCCNCFSSSKRHNQLSLEPEEEPNAFDLTWRNYLLPTSCCCIPNIFKRNQRIRLDDDDDIIDDELFISPHDQQPHFFDNSNNNNRYHGRAVRGYLDDPRDWEFDSMLAEGGEFPPAGFVTRNPFGRKNSNKKKRKHRKHNQHNNYPRVIQQNDDDQEIFSEEIQDAEFLGDDQIAHLAYERSKNMDPYGEEGYIDSTYGRPLSQEMQPPPTQKEFYAPRTMPSYYFVDQEDNEGCYEDQQQHDNNKGKLVVQEHEYYQQQQQEQEEQERREHQQQNEASSSTAPVVTTVAEQAQDLLSERLDDLTDKLIYIRKNMMDMNNKKEQEPDNTTLRTINKHNDNNDNYNDDQNDNDSIKKGPESDKTASDMDSIASEALNEYEQPDDDDDEHERRRRSAASQYKFPFSGGDSPPFGSDHHPFSYFTEHNNNNNNNKNKHKHTASSSSLSSSYSRRHSALVDDDNNTPGLTIRGVLDFGKKWLGS